MVSDPGMQGRRDARRLVRLAEVVVPHCRLTACMWISIFLLKPLLNRVKWRIPVRIGRFARSTCELEVFARSGSPIATAKVCSTTLLGL